MRSKKEYRSNGHKRSNWNQNQCLPLDHIFTTLQDSLDLPRAAVAPALSESEGPDALRLLLFHYNYSLIFGSHLLSLAIGWPGRQLQRSARGPCPALKIRPAGFL
jgi:hypothetical protein